MSVPFYCTSGIPYPRHWLPLCRGHRDNSSTLPLGEAGSSPGRNWDSCLRLGLQEECTGTLLCLCRWVFNLVICHWSLSMVSLLLLGKFWMLPAVGKPRTCLILSFNYFFSLLFSSCFLHFFLKRWLFHLLFCFKPMVREILKESGVWKKHPQNTKPPAQLKAF